MSDHRALKSTSSRPRHPPRQITRGMNFTLSGAGFVADFALQTSHSDLSVDAHIAPFPLSRPLLEISTISIQQG
ncbi:unnamed protein product [Mesocestoides corti]|uniref:Uncharacterized protein n=1 Tax=Mesocestoides corti TaxID=53468 RepID=A0A0R3UFM5_MESCO|nr:unnamed protein product [Mesocestoides corti]